MSQYPPDMSGELAKIKNEIHRIEHELKELQKVKLTEEKEMIRTVPPITSRLRLSTRRKSRHEENRKNPEVRRGIKPIGVNGTIWKAKIDMNKMFKENKLLRGAVPPPTTARPTEMGTA